MKLLNILGNTYGSLTVIRFAGSKNNRATWECRCDCDRMTIVSGKALRNGQTSSCGCGMLRNLRLFGASRKTHGLSHLAEYHIWELMISRCTKPQHKGYKHYGGRGISVCGRWLTSVTNFISDVGLRPSARHSIDRINNDGNYEPGNVRWATMQEQVLNKRKRSIYPARNSRGLFCKPMMDREEVEAAGKLALEPVSEVKQ